MSRLPAMLTALVLALAAGCTYYQTAPGVYSTTPASRFDRSWAAVTGALADQGVTITTRDRDTGIAQGRRNGIDVTASVQTQADGSVQVRFNATGSTGTDPGLIDRITAAYHRRMGRQSSPAG